METSSNFDSKNAEQPVKKERHRFKPGQSGNPGGLPKGVGEVKKLARQWAPQAIETLATIMQDSGATPSARVAAATTLLDRGFGKPLQQVEVGQAGAFSDLPEEDLDKFIATTLAQLSGAKQMGDLPTSETPSIN